MEELIRYEDKFSAVRDGLRSVNKLDADKLISSVSLVQCLMALAYRPQLAASEARVSNAARSATSRVSQMLHLRGFVKKIPLIRDAVNACRSRLLEIVYDVCLRSRAKKVESNLISSQMLSDERIEKLDTLLSESLNDDASHKVGTLTTNVTSSISLSCRVEDSMR